MHPASSNLRNFSDSVLWRFVENTVSVWDGVPLRGARGHETDRALRRSFTTQAVILADQFREPMRGKGVPSEVVDIFAGSIVIDDKS